MSRMTLVRERLFSPVGLHAVGFSILAIATIVLGIRVGLESRLTISMPSGFRRVIRRLRNGWAS